MLKTRLWRQLRFWNVFAGYKGLCWASRTMLSHPLDTRHWTVSTKTLSTVVVASRWYLPLACVALCRLEGFNPTKLSYYNSPDSIVFEHNAAISKEVQGTVPFSWSGVHFEALIRS